MPAGDQTYTAQWKINQYTLSFDSTGGSTVNSITQDYDTSVTTPENPTREGYTFTGWDTDLPETMPAEDQTYTAQWDANEYTLSFDSSGGSTVNSITQDYDTVITAPENPTREGYTFTGWDTPIPENMPAGDQTYTAQWEINQYTLNFDSAGGSTVKSITQDYDTSVTAPADPTREGYTFTGWDTDLPETMPAEDQTYTAQWDANEYTLSFDSTGGSTVNSITQDYDTAITAPENPIREGYIFTGWGTDLPETMPAGDQTYTAQWEINQYTLSFDSTGGSTIESITQDYDTSVTAPADPTREGYTFTGWDTDLPETMPAEDQTYTAQWDANEYTLSFDSTGGSTVNSITQDYDTAITAPENPTREGYTFTGWDTPIPENMPAGDQTYTAQWEINQYTLNFDSAGGSTVKSITQDYDTSVTAPADPTREGYTFMGWDTDLPETMPAGDQTYTAQWEINQYTLSFDSTGGSTIESITQDYDTSVTAPADPTREGYTFTGWDTDLPETIPAGDQTYTAQWEINQYTLNFDSAGGSTVESITQDYDTAITAPADPTREGYTFTGWDTDLPETMPAEDQTYTAQWDANEYTLSFDSSGGSTVNSITQDYDTVITPPENPTRKGYTFTGWDTDLPETMPAGDQTYTAQWEINQYTLSFDSTGGSTVKSITQDYDTAITAPADPIREGYTFIGWDTEFPETMPEEDQTYTAQWEVFVPVISELDTISTPTSNSTPSYSFISSISGTITYYGECQSSQTKAQSGVNTITFNPLSDRRYTDCALTVTHENGTLSNRLDITEFTIDTTDETEEQEDSSGQEDEDSKTDSDNSSNNNEDESDEEPIEVDEEEKEEDENSKTDSDNSSNNNEDESDGESIEVDEEEKEEDENSKTDSDNSSNNNEDESDGESIEVDEEEKEEDENSKTDSDNSSNNNEDGSDVEPIEVDEEEQGYSQEDQDSEKQEDQSSEDTTEEETLDQENSQQNVGEQFEEPQVPNNGDGNSDGIKDSEQSNVTNYLNQVTTSYNVMSINKGVNNQIRSLRSLPESDVGNDEQYVYPMGLYEFTIDLDEPGDIADVTIYTDQIYDTDTWEYRKYDGSDKGFTDVSSQVTYGTAFNGEQEVTTISYSIVDGGPLDEDGEVNGSIMDPAGPALRNQNITPPNTGSRPVNLLLYGLIFVIGSGLIVGVFRDLKTSL